MDPIVGYLGIGAMFLLMAMGVPIAFAMALPSFVGFLLFMSWDATLAYMISVLSNYVSNYTMAVVPVFIFMGQMAYLTGLLEGMFDMAKKWLGRLPGGLAISVVFANGIFGACSGSASFRRVSLGYAALSISAALRASGNRSFLLQL